MDTVKRTPAQHIEVGEATPDFTLLDADGNRLKLSALSGERGVVVGFMHGAYCAHCMQQLNRSNLIADKLDAVGVRLVWILDDQATTVAAYRLAASPPPRFSLLPDSQPQVRSNFGIHDDDSEPAPKLYYLDDERVIRYLEQPDNPHAPPDIDRIIELAKAQKTDTL